MKPKIRLVPLGTPEEFQDVHLFADPDTMTLRQLIQQAPALSMEPISPELLDKPLNNIRISQIEASPDLPLYRPPEITWDINQQSTTTETPKQPPTEPPTTAQDDTLPAEELNKAEQPCYQNEKLNEADAVKIAYSKEIEDIASFLRTEKGLSVLVYCDKLMVAHLWKDIVRKAGREAKLLEIPDEDDAGGLMARSLRQRQLSQLKKDIEALKEGQVLVIPHLDLLAGGPETQLSNEARELTELVYKHPDRLILAFADRSLSIPEVLSMRFSVRRLISGVSRTVIDKDGTEKRLGELLVTASEADKFIGFDAGNLYKNIAGMNPIQILHAITYAVKEHAASGPVPVEQLYQAIRAFKVQTSANFEVPDVNFDDIGGYDEVKNTLAKALNLMTGAYQLPDEKLRRELIPRGFIFYGPPGTGKTLFAKAIANMLNATIQVVSGPEVMDMYVGESERKLREFFAEARRNAPSVLVFDEFDAIAAKRTGREDGGSRAGNAIVAQLLTEMDGFRPDVPMLVIGTTNRLELIDEALLRPSRFQAIQIGLPQAKARQAIAQVHARHFRVDEHISPGLLEIIAENTEGFNGDEIRSLFREACVGLHCETPPREINAHRLGELVGNLRRNKEKRFTETSHEITHTTTPTPTPTGPMMPLTGN
jgi:transitional endoplasmic reticulum ATPase